MVWITASNYPCSDSTCTNAHFRGDICPCCGQEFPWGYVSIAHNPPLVYKSPDEDRDEARLDSNELLRVPAVTPRVLGKAHAGYRTKRPVRTRFLRRGRRGA